MLDGLAFDLLSTLQDNEDLTLESSSTWVFPSWAHPLLGFYAVGIHKGGIDYDDINARMAPENRAQAAVIMGMLEKWEFREATLRAGTVRPVAWRQ